MKFREKGGRRATRSCVGLISAGCLLAMACGTTPTTTQTAGSTQREPEPEPGGVSPVVPIETEQRCAPVVVSAAVDSQRAGQAAAIALALDSTIADHEAVQATPVCVRSVVAFDGHVVFVDVITPIGDVRMSFGVFHPRETDGLSPQQWDVARIGGTLAEVRRALESAAWLAGHPELRGVSDFGGFPLSLRAVRTDARSTFCVTDREPAPQLHWCWEHVPTADRFSVWLDYDDIPPLPDGVPYVPAPTRGTLTLGFPDGDRLDRWVVRFPDASIAQATPLPLRAPDWTPRPAWFPTRHRTSSTASAPPRGGDATPLRVVPAPDLGPLSTRLVTTVVTDDGDAIDIAWPESEQTEGFADHALLFCARIDGSWRCAAPTAVEHGTYQVYDHWDFQLFDVARDGSRLALAHRTLMGVGGNGEFSGAAGEWHVEIFRVLGDRLDRLGVLQLGAMEWVTLRRGEMGRYYRRVARQFASASTRGARCVAISRREAAVGNADGSFHADGPQRSAGAALPVTAVPETVALDPFGNGVPVGITLERPADAVHAPALDWTGVWRVEDGGRLVRMSTDPEAACPE